MQNIKTKVDEYIIELAEEQFHLKNKLQQWWRLFGKSKLRQELDEIQYLRATIEIIARRLEEEINYLALGKFQLSPK